MATANQTTSLACEAGDPQACSLLGTSLLLEARAKRVSPEPALKPFLRACEAKDWHGCGMAAHVKAALAQDGRPVAARAFPLAMASCRDGNGGACIYVGDRAARAGDRTTAAVHYRTACEMNLEACGPAAMGEYPCLKAVELGAAPATPRSSAGTEGAHPEFKRISGQKNIQPPLPEARGMCRMRLSRVTARATICVSESGVPERIVFDELSGAPAWNRTLFETMRTWRYSPYVDKNGRPRAKCRGITFIYNPKC